MRVAIIGLYNSGSTVLSQIMGELGFELGEPFWGKYFESRSLREKLIEWWDEPQLIERIPQKKRVRHLSRWMKKCERKNPLVCAKHPLLCLSAGDLEEAWGPDLMLIRAARPLEESIAGLERRGWFSGEERRMQTVLHEAIEPFFAEREHHAVDYNELLRQPVETIQSLVDHLGIPVPRERIEAAASVVNTT